MKSDVAVAHSVLYFLFGNERRNAVHDQHVDGTRTHKCFRNFKSLLAVVGLRNKQRIYINAEISRIYRVKCVFRVHKSSRAAALLRFRNDM